MKFHNFHDFCKIDQIPSFSLPGKSSFIYEVYYADFLCLMPLETLYPVCAKCSNAFQFHCQFLQRKDLFQFYKLKKHIFLSIVKGDLSSWQFTNILNANYCLWPYKSRSPSKSLDNKCNPIALINAIYRTSMSSDSQNNCIRGPLK